MIYSKYIKRVLDILISFFVLLILLPVYIVIGIVIRITDNSNAFYTQVRTGQYGKDFHIYKFRTMKDKKITKLGRILRFTSLDELPQFLNVLKGDMSIIGPRPWIPDYYNNFNDVQKRRVDVKPGIIGLAQVNGRKSISIFEKINYDLMYIDNISLITDLKIFFKSINVVFEKEKIVNMDAYIENEINMLKNQH